jgi:CPA2 family monovalent cation:H+ antiporter-2
LSERGELDSVPGEVATGWLVVQDLAVVPILILLSALSGNNGSGISVWSSLGTVALAIGKASVVLMLVLYLGRHGIPKLLSAVAAFRNRELLLLTTIGIVFFVGLTTYAAGLSIALGAFLAGLLVAETSQNHAVFAEIRPLRDLFAVVFFVSLGMTLQLGSMMSVWPVVVALTLCVVIVKGIITYGLLRFMRYHRKTAFMVGLYLTQVSEFGFVLARAGVGAGALTDAHAALLVAVTFFTIMISAPLITRSHDVYYAFRGIMKRFPKLFREEDKEGEFPKDTGYPIADHVVICGYGRVGKYIGRALQMSGVQFLVVDYDQSTLKSLKESGIQTIYGDPADKEVLDYAQVDLAKAIVIAIPDRHTQEMVIGNAVSLNRKIKIICRTHHEEDQRHLKSLGVHLVVQPEFEAALSIVGRLLSEFGVTDDEIAGKMSRLKIEHGVG